MKKLAIAAAIGLLPVVAQAQMIEDFKLSSTEDLLELCDPEPASAMDEEALQFCHGFIVGTGLFYVELVQSGVIPRWACAEPPPALNEIRTAFVTWARSNPDHLADDAVNGFWQAMADTWPCAS